jgi:hypothetical protein
MATIFILIIESYTSTPSNLSSQEDKSTERETGREEKERDFTSSDAERVEIQCDSLLMPGATPASEAAGDGFLPAP